MEKTILSNNLSKFHLQLQSSQHSHHDHVRGEAGQRSTSTLTKKQISACLCMRHVWIVLTVYARIGAYSECSIALPHFRWNRRINTCFVAKTSLVLVIFKSSTPQQSAVNAIVLLYKWTWTYIHNLNQILVFAMSGIRPCAKDVKDCAILRRSLWSDFWLRDEQGPVSGRITLEKKRINLMKVWHGVTRRQTKSSDQEDADFLANHVIASKSVEESEVLGRFVKREESWRNCGD